MLNPKPFLEIYFVLYNSCDRPHQLHVYIFEDSLQDSVLRMVLETLHVVKGAGPSLTPGGAAPGQR